MRGFVVFAGCLILGFGPAFGQEGKIRFEVATVKPVRASPGMGVTFRGGPGTSDPIQYNLRASLRALVTKALAVKTYQLIVPDWLDSEGFEIVAKVPPGATKEQLSIMLQNLMVERFNLTYHHEAKEMSVYELTVAKDGPQLRESDLSIQSAPRTLEFPPVRPETNKNGCPQFPPGPRQFIGRLTDGIMCWTGGQQPMSGLATLMESELGRPVVDKTGLTGKYDITLRYSRDGLAPFRRDPATVANEPPDATAPSGGPSLFKAVQEQLRLTLKSGNDPVDVLIIDHIDKVPTDN